MAGRHRKPSRHRGRHRQPSSPARVALPAGTAAAVVVAAVVVFTHADANGQAPATAHLVPPAAAAVTNPPPSVLAYSTTRPAPRPPSSSRSPHEVRHRSLLERHHQPAALRIRATADCYVQVTNRHGKLMVRRILHRGQHVAFRHHGLHVVLGNAGGVRISIDGQRPRVAGGLGQVRRFPVG